MIIELLIFQEEKCCYQKFIYQFVFVESGECFYFFVVNWDELYEVFVECEVEDFFVKDDDYLLVVCMLGDEFEVKIFMIFLIIVKSFVEWFCF